VALPTRSGLDWTIEMDGSAKNLPVCEDETLTMARHCCATPSRGAVSDKFVMLSPGFRHMLCARYRARKSPPAALRMPRRAPKDGGVFAARGTIAYYNLLAIPRVESRH
jgi:hypothetical protein